MRRLAAFLIGLALGAPVFAQDIGRGGALYVSFCATCHGAEGRGDGPMAPILAILPADLTGLRARAGGRFPMGDLARKIDGRDPLLAHGGPMPLFGEFFDGESVALKTETGQPLLASPQIVDLLAYLETIQE